MMNQVNSTNDARRAESAGGKAQCLLVLMIDDESKSFPAPYFDHSRNLGAESIRCEMQTLTISTQIQRIKNGDSFL